MKQYYWCIKNYVFNLITYDDGDTKRSEKIFSTSMMILIILNTLSIITESVHGLDETSKTILNAFELFSIVVFTIEYLLRIWTANLLYPNLKPMRARLKYLGSGMAIIDLLAILPFYVPFLIPFDLRALRTIRIIRLFRLFKVSRFTKSIEMIGRVVKDRAAALLSAISIMAILLIISATLMYNVESAAQPDKFESVFSGFWWAIATLTTVGYGDIFPVTVLGKVFSGIIAVIGIGIVALPTSIFCAGFIEELSKGKTCEKTCPHCGGRIE